jgi:uncharacterized protein YjbI with pentapeptide repeats
MSGLLLEKHLRESKKEDEVRTLARVRTLTTLSRLDKYRKKSILQFLPEARLIDKDSLIIELSGAHLSEAILYDVNLSGDNLRGADLSDALLQGANLVGASLTTTTLSGTNLSKAYMPNVNTRGLLMIYYIMGKVDPENPNLNITDPRTDLSKAIQWKAYLVGANLVEANLSEASLYEANLEYTNLSRANLSGAYLSGASLYVVDLSNAIVTDKQLTNAKSLKGAIMPNGSKHP